jgi:prepilin-type N-terminal cleavage/methylation domain-containing protein
MCASRRDRLRHGVSLVEVLLTLFILAVALVPIITLFTNTHRIGHSARRQVDVTLHVQMLLEALAELEPADFPTVSQDQETILLADQGGGVTGGASARYQEVVDMFRQQKVPVDGMKRTVIAKRLRSGELQIRVEVDWDAVVGEERTRQHLTIPMLSTPRNWQ